MIRLGQPEIGDEEVAAVSRVLRSGNLSQGPEVAAFEEEFTDVVDSSVECIAVNSGTSALHLTLVALGVGPGDEVIVPSFTFAATANSVAFTGAKPVFVDIEADSYNMDPRKVEEAMTPRTVAVMPVHLYGQPADLTSLSQLASSRGIALVEDASQAHCATWLSRPVGTWGIAGTFSFYPTKNMTAGEGGMVTTSDPQVARRIRLLRNQGQEVRYFNEVVGLNNRMSDLHAAIGRVQLRKLRDWTEARRRNAAYFDLRLTGVVKPRVQDGATHSYHQYTIRVDGSQRDEFMAHLLASGIASGVYYPTPNHRLPSFNEELDLPETEAAAREVVSIPVHPGISSEDRETIVQAVNSFEKRVN